MRSDEIVQRGLRTPTGPFFARFFIGIILGLVAEFAFMRVLTRLMMKLSNLQAQHSGAVDCADARCLRELLQRLALDARHDAGDEPARQAQLDNGDQRAVRIKGVRQAPSDGPHAMVRLLARVIGVDRTSAPLALRALPRNVWFFFRSILWILCSRNDFDPYLAIVMA